jgi:hypothetical protein
MSAALAPALLVASLVLCVSGALKLRSSGAAMRALGGGEVALGAVCTVHPTQGLAVALAVVYASFTAAAEVLRRRRQACGCFGEKEFPVSLAHVVTSGLLGTVAAGASLAGVRGLGWLWGRPVAQTAVLLIGIAVAVYAVVLVYTVVPRAWSAWERA